MPGRCVELGFAPDSALTVELESATDPALTVELESESETDPESETEIDRFLNLRGAMVDCVYGFEVVGSGDW